MDFTINYLNLVRHVSDFASCNSNGGRYVATEKIYDNGLDLDCIM